jgi:hypothetical protein
MLIKIKIRMTKEMQLISMYSNVSIKISPYVRLCREYCWIGAYVRHESTGFISRVFGSMLYYNMYAYRRNIKNFKVSKAGIYGKQRRARAQAGSFKMSKKPRERLFRQPGPAAFQTQASFRIQSSRSSRCPARLNTRTCIRS